MIYRVVTLVLLGLLLGGHADAAKIHLLLIDGQNNHDWKATTPILKSYLVGTGANEPLVYTVTYGKGRVFVSLLGHDVSSAALSDTLLLVGRGALWAAKSRIALPIPPDFPTLQPDVR
jgi:type 1 glutamine amidotransferase